MSVLSIIKKDEAHLRVFSELSILQELSDYFTFEVPNAKYHPLVKSKVWDGKLRLYSLLTKELHVGLLPYLEHFAKINEYTIDYEKYIPKADTITLESVKQFVASLNVSLPEGESVREYQLDAIYQAIQSGRILLLSPTGSGKSLIIYCLLRWNERFNRRQIVLVPRTSLVEQMYSDFQSYSKNNGWKVQDNCGRVYSGHDKNTELPIVISTWQSVYNLPKPWFTKFDCIFGDEAHDFKAKSLTGIMNKLTNAFVRIGTSGTLDGTKTHKLVLEGLFGKVYRVTTTRQLMDDSHLASLKIFAVILEYPEDIRKAMVKNKYKEEIDFICAHTPRNKFIRNLAIKQKGNTLILFQFVEKHGKILWSLIKEKAEENRKVFFVYGGTDTEQREEIRKITEIEQDAIIIASYGTFSTGINIRNLHNIILASPTKSRIRNLQSIGRGLRLGKDKTSCNLYDIGDDVSHKENKNFTLLHMIERLKIYNEENFDYRIVKVSI